MKIRTDFVTNSSSSSFTVAICFKMKDGKEITHSDHWIDEETDLVVSKDPFELAKAKDIDELIDLLNESIFIGVVGYDYENDEVMYDDEGNEIYVKADEDEYEDYLSDFKQFGDSLKDKLKDYSMEDIQTITLKTFETDDMSASYNYDELPPENRDEYDTDYQVYSYNLVTENASYYDEYGFVETNGGRGGRIQLKLDEIYVKEEDHEEVEANNSAVKKDPLVIDNNVLVRYKGKEKKVIVPDGIEIIGENAFEKCNRIEEVVLPNGLKEIGDMAFSGCDSLERINIPETVEKVGWLAFNDCKKLMNDDGFLIINKILFAVDEKNYENLIIPDGVEIIDKELFFYCEDMVNVRFPDTLKEIGNGAFMWCGWIEEITLPNGLRTIGERAFGKTSFKYIEIPESVQYIGEDAFMESGLKEVRLPKHLNKYKKTAFDKGVKFI